MGNKEGDKDLFFQNQKPAGGSENILSSGNFVGKCTPE